jgi:hypothetical protein
VKESIEISWEDGTVDELDRAIFVKLAGKYPLAFQYPWFAYNPYLKNYETFKDDRLPTIRIKQSHTLKKIIEVCQSRSWSIDDNGNLNVTPMTEEELKILEKKRAKGIKL